MKIIDDCGNLVNCSCGCTYVYETADLIPTEGYMSVACPKCGQVVLLIQQLDVKVKQQRVVEVEGVECKK